MDSVNTVIILKRIRFSFLMRSILFIRFVFIGRLGVEWPLLTPEAYIPEDINTGKKSPM